MEALSLFFKQLVNMSITASYIITAVLLARLFLKRMPKAYSYWLWTIVGFRLICPFSFSSQFSIFNLAIFNPVRKETNQNAAKVLNTVKQANHEATGITIQENIPPINVDISPEQSLFGHNMSALIGWTTAGIWLIGLLLLLVYFIVNYINCKKKVSQSILLNDNIYECDNIASPFVLGIIAPKIYIPFRLSKEEQTYILAHERYHIKRKDYLIKIFAFLLASIYWFNPLIWLAYFLMTRDMEMSCDEKVILQLGMDIKKTYSMSLLSFAVNHRQKFAGPIAFGETDLKRRITNILRFKKPRLFVSILGITVLISLIIICIPDGSTATKEASVKTEHSNKPVQNTKTTKTNTEKSNAMSLKQITGYVEKWITAFCSRDADTIQTLSSPEVIKTLQEQSLLTIDKAASSFGFSSPWPMEKGQNFQILNLDKNHATILYYAWSSEPHITVWREELSYQTQDNTFLVIEESLQILDYIVGKAQFLLAYPDYIINNTAMDYLTNGMGERLNQNALYNSNSYYKDLFKPDTAASKLLNLLVNPNKVVITSKIGSDANTAQVLIHFVEDNGDVEITMVRPYGETGIWIPQSNRNKSSKYPSKNITSKENLPIMTESFEEPSAPLQELSKEVDLDQDGIKEKIVLKDLGYNGGDGGCSLHIYRLINGVEKKISLPDVCKIDAHPFYTVWSKEGVDIMLEDTLINQIPLSLIEEIYDPINSFTPLKKSSHKETVFGDTISGFSILQDESKKTWLTLKYYLSGYFGHSDCFGYGIIKLQLNNDNTWIIKSEFLLSADDKQLS